MSHNHSKRVYRGDDNFAKIYLILHSLFLLHQVMLYSKGIGNEGKGAVGLTTGAEVGIGASPPCMR